MTDFPKDSDEMALQKLSEQGVDMNKPIVFEFCICADNQLQADNICKALNTANIGDSYEIEYDKGELGKDEIKTENNKEFWPSFTVYIFLKMMPHHNKLIEFQERLNKQIAPLGATLDGWTLQV